MDYKLVPVITSYQKFTFSVTACGVLCLLFPVGAPLFASFFLGVMMKGGRHRAIPQVAGRCRAQWSKHVVRLHSRGTPQLGYCLGSARAADCGPRFHCPYAVGSGRYHRRVASPITLPRVRSTLFSVSPACLAFQPLRRWPRNSLMKPTDGAASRSIRDGPRGGGSDGTHRPLSTAIYIALVPGLGA